MRYLVVFVIGFAVGKIPAAGWSVMWAWGTDLVKETWAALTAWIAKLRAKRP